MRRPDLTHEPTGHKAQRIRLTGYLLWDDDHNGKADIGPRIESVGKNKYHHPWRSTPWEMHPVLKIEAFDGSIPTITQSSAAVAPPITATAAAPPASPLPAVAAAPRLATIVEPVKIKIPYGETILPRGMKLEIVQRDAQSVTLRYLGTDVKVPLLSTDLQSSGE